MVQERNAVSQYLVFTDRDTQEPILDERGRSHNSRWYALQLFRLTRPRSTGYILGHDLNTAPYAFCDEALTLETVQ